MRPNSSLSRDARGLRGCAALLMLCLCSTGCASLVRGTARGYDLAPNGMTRADDGFRRALVAGSYAGAFARAAAPRAGAPDDPLLRALYRGLTGYYAGELDVSTASFAAADALAERRLTKSLSRAATSVVTSDAVLPYVPTRTEALFLRYYAMHAYLRAGRMEDAVVEARRLGRALEDAATGLAPGERPLHATMRDAAGAVFEAAGERNDALVSYRNAALLRGMGRRDVDSITLPVAAADSATLIVFVESGFVAHRVDRGLTIGLSGEGVARDSLSDRPASSVVDSLAVPRRTESLTARALRLLDALPGGGVFMDDSVGSYHDRRGRHRVKRPMRIADGASSFVRVAWPALLRPSSPVGPMSLQVAVGDSARAERAMEPGADVTNAIAEDFRRDRPAVLARSIARAVAKGAVAEALREKHGDWAGTLASLAGTALERADTRSWHLLPGAISMMRLTVPAGTHAPLLTVDTDVEALTVTLPATVLGPGETRVVSTRIWRDGSAFTLPVARTTAGTRTGVDAPRRPVDR